MGFRAVVNEHIPLTLLSVLADGCLGNAKLRLSESNLCSLINIFDESRNYPELSAGSGYSVRRIRQLLGKIKESSSSKLADSITSLQLESRFGDGVREEGAAATLAQKISSQLKQADKGGVAKLDDALQDLEDLVSTGEPNIPCSHIVEFSS